MNSLKIWLDSLDGDSLLSYMSKLMNINVISKKIERHSSSYKHIDTVIQP